MKKRWRFCTGPHHSHIGPRLGILWSKSRAAARSCLGKEREGFGWDNEHLAHRIDVPGFSITRHKVSNGEYLEFVRAGGVAPHFWSKEKGDNGAWFYRGMFERIPLPLDRPAWVTWNQANAFAKWRGLQLPSEAQFHLAAERTSPDPVRDNFGFHAWDPVAVIDAQGIRAGNRIPMARFLLLPRR